VSIAGCRQNPGGGEPVQRPGFQVRRAIRSPAATRSLFLQQYGLKFRVPTWSFRRNFILSFHYTEVSGVPNETATYVPCIERRSGSGPRYIAEELSPPDGAEWLDLRP